MVSCLETSTDDSRVGIHPWFSGISGKVFFNCLSNIDVNVSCYKTFDTRVQILCDKLHEGILTARAPEVMVLFCVHVNFHRSTDGCQAFCTGAGVY